MRLFGRPADLGGDRRDHFVGQWSHRSLLRRNPRTPPVAGFIQHLERRAFQEVMRQGGGVGVARAYSISDPRGNTSVQMDFFPRGQNASFSAARYANQLQGKFVHHSFSSIDQPGYTGVGNGCVLIQIQVDA